MIEGKENPTSAWIRGSRQEKCWRHADAQRISSVMGEVDFTMTASRVQNMRNGWGDGGGLFAGEASKSFLQTPNAGILRKIADHVRRRRSMSKSGVKQRSPLWRLLGQ